MSVIQIPPLLLAFVALSLVPLVAFSLLVPRPKNRKFLPPGPEPDFLTGNRRQVPSIKPWRWFKDLHDQYGDIIYLQMGKNPTIVLGSAQVAWDLLEKRSNATSSRPRLIMGGELLSDNRRGLMMQYGDRWRAWRKILHNFLNTRSVDAYRPIQDFESKQLLCDILRKPAGFRQHIERYAASVVVCITYGRRVHDVLADEVVCFNRDSMAYLTSVNIPGKYAVEAYPQLLHLPKVLTPWRTEALNQRQKDIFYLTGLVREVSAKVTAGTAQTSFCRQLLENQASMNLTELDIAYACSSPFGAGVETTMGTILCFLLACAEFGGEFLHKAQTELDRVVGRDRLPDYQDYDALEYVRAVIAETLRWRPVAVLGGTPHAATEDISFNGYMIEKGTTIIANLWSIHLNAKDYPDPHHFRPERFTEARNFPGPNGHAAYGWGRRVCVGQWLANNSLFLNISRLIWAFNISSAQDPLTGKPVPVDIFAFSNGFNSLPLPFRVDIQPRSPAHASLILREFEGARDEMSLYE